MTESNEPVHINTIGQECEIAITTRRLHHAQDWHENKKNADDLLYNQLNGNNETRNIYRHFSSFQNLRKRNSNVCCTWI